MGLCFSCLPRFLLSFRLTGGGVPIAARAIALTALLARNGLGFFFFATEPVNHRGDRCTQRNPDSPLRRLPLPYSDTTFRDPGKPGNNGD